MPEGKVVDSHKIQAVTNVHCGRAVVGIQTFRTMIQQSKQTVVVADSSRIGVVTPALICPVAHIHMLITDKDATDKLVAPFIERGIEVCRV